MSIKTKIKNVFLVTVTLIIILIIPFSILNVTTVTILSTGLILGFSSCILLWYYIEYRNALRENAGDKDV